MRKKVINKQIYNFDPISYVLYKRTIDWILFLVKYFLNIKISGNIKDPPLSVERIEGNIVGHNLFHIVQPHSIKKYDQNKIMIPQTIFPCNLSYEFILT